MKRSIVFILIILCNLPLAAQFDLIGFLSESQNIHSDSALGQLLLDSLLKYENDEYTTGGWYDYHIVCSKDKVVTIFQFDGEGCGAYCNPFFKTIIRIWDPVSNTYSFFEEDHEFQYRIDSIVPIDQHYLLFGIHSGRPRGIESVWGQSVSLISRSPKMKLDWSFRTMNSNLIPETSESRESELRFFKAQKKLTYVYYWYEEGENLTVYRQKGSYRYNGKTFIQESLQIGEVSSSSE